MADGKWMEKAFANSHGQFKAKAKKAGMGTQAFAKKEAASPSASTKTKRQANLAKLGAKYGGGHHGHVKTPPPDHAKNPGDYNTEAHSNTYHGPSAKAVGVKQDLDAIGGAPTPTNEERGVTVAMDTDGAAHHPSMSTTAHKFAPPAAAGAHGWGHPVSQRAGHLRMSGVKGAHRVGKR
jgi:hypothetical protein